ncbi:MAG: dehydrogenase (quinone) [Rickettsiaceae bacterium]|jgi:formate hydrogenlyase subunit 3/multisubunit Na+/H+ antiporter MnhD subunit|nr:dehydrogenase (quinone) [Rickettsiaceae bacterium]
MMKIQLLPLLPFIALLFIWCLNKLPRLSAINRKISPSFAMLFLILVFGLRNITKPITWKLLSVPGNLCFALSFGKQHFLFLSLLGLMWLLTSIYSSRYFAIMGDQRIERFQAFLLCVIGFITCLILGKNWLTIMLFYQLLALAICLFVKDFCTKQSAKSARNFGFFILSSSSLLFFAVAFVFKISGKMELMQGGVLISDQTNIWASTLSTTDISEYSWLFFFFAASICLIAFAPFYLAFDHLYYLSPPAIIVALLSFNAASLILLFKVITGVFGIKLFAYFMTKIHYHDFLVIALGFNLLTCGFLAIFSRNLKQISIFLFFGQMVMAVTAFLALGLSAKKMQIVITSFIVVQMLIFFAIGNINLYLRESQTKELNGIFYQLRITVLLLIFAFLSLSGLFPGVGMLEKYWLFKEAFTEKFAVAIALLTVNILLSLACSIKVLYPMVEISAKSAGGQNHEIAKDIEHDLSLMLPILVLCFIIFSLLFPFIANFFAR